MLSVEQLLALLADRVPVPASKEEALASSRGLVLAEDLVASTDEPAFDRSAMDGFAVSADAVPGIFQVVGECLPGASVPSAVAGGEALRVFTGSALPPGVRVVMQEDAVQSGGIVEIATIAGVTHVRLRGSASGAGDVLLKKGTVLTPAALAVLAAEGRTRPRVFARPRVAHLTTGSEVVDPCQVPAQGQIRNTNSVLIRALLEESGAALTGHRHSGEALSESLGACAQPEFETADLLLVSGGASGGAHDHTAKLLETLGFEIFCRKLDCRPGKPLIVGVRGNRMAMGLPGNPVSHYVTFQVFVRRVLALMSGAPPVGFTRAVLSGAGEGVLQENARETFWPARLSRDEVEPLPWLDSGHLGALARVNALIRVPSGMCPVAGHLVEVVECVGAR